MAERMVLCGLVGGSVLPVRDDNPLRLALGGPSANVHLRFEDVLRGMWGDVPHPFRDLVELAAYVYVADQAVRRGHATDQDNGAGWRRRLCFRVPVRCPDVWGDPAVTAELSRTLGFLTEDDYEFQFERLLEDEPFQRYFDFLDGAADPVEEVVLFSGGLDSLAGAVRSALDRKRRVLLVHHRSATKLEPRHADLVRGLRGRAGRPPVHLPVRVDKDRGLNREFTQRSRSFLFAALGATLAAMAGLRRVTFYENGVVGVNLPPSAQVLGPAPAGPPTRRPWPAWPGC